VSGPIGTLEADAAQDLQRRIRDAGHPDRVALGFLGEVAFTRQEKRWTLHRHDPPMWMLYANLAAIGFLLKRQRALAAE
jgi:hypothetical protein